MAIFCARVRFRLGQRVRIDADVSELVLQTDGPEEVVLRAPHGSSIKDAEHVALIAKPYQSEADAIEAGLRWRGILEKAFARLDIGADFGDRAATGAATEHGLAAFAAQL